MLQMSYRESYYVVRRYVIFQQLLRSLQTYSADDLSVHEFAIITQTFALDENNSRSGNRLTGNALARARARKPANRVVYTLRQTFTHFSFKLLSGSTG